MIISLIAPLSPNAMTGPRNSLTILAGAINEYTSCQANVYSTTFITAFDINGVSVKPMSDECFKFTDVAILSGIYNKSVVHSANVFKSLGIPYVISPRGSFVKNSFRQSPIKKFFYLSLFARSAIHHSSALHFLSEDERSSSLFNHISNFICGNIANTPATPNKIKKSKIIGYLGRFDVKAKGLDMLLQSVYRCKEIFLRTGWTVELVGPDFRNGKKYIHSRIRELGLVGIVQVFDPLDSIQKAQFLSKISVLAHLSRNEGQPQSVLEAMVHGCMIVTTRGSNMTTIVSQSSCGVEVPRNVKQISRELEKIITGDYDIGLRQQRATNFAKPHFSSECVAKKFIQGLEALCP